jgi:signal transduction histidine kinase
MSLRLRLNLFYGLFLGAVLGVLGLLVHLLTWGTLLRGLDASLRDALALALPLVQGHEGEGRILERDEQALAALPSDLTLYLFAGERLLDRVGRLPPPAHPRTGCFREGKARYCGQAVAGGLLLAGRSLVPLEEAVEGVDRVLLLLFPAGLLLALILGFLLTDRALKPLDRMSRRALELARAPDPRARLPEPETQDELARLARAQNLLLEALEGLLERERRFVRLAAHELRTPLSVLIGRLEQALEKDPIPRASVEKALEAALHLFRLAERLLLLVRAEGPLRREPVDLVGVVLEALEDLGWLLHQENPNSPPEKRVLLDLPDHLPFRGDPALLRALARNLLENALRFARERVAVRLQAGPPVHLLVEDDGPGVPPVEREAIFRPFHRTHPGPGSGLGLALVQAVARAHGGRAWVEESPLGGARFWVELGGGDG